MKLNKKLLLLFISLGGCFNNNHNKPSISAKNKPIEKNIAQQLIEYIETENKEAIMALVRVNNIDINEGLGCYSTKQDIIDRFPIPDSELFDVYVEDKSKYKTYSKLESFCCEFSNEIKNTALEIAIISGHLEIFEFLIDNLGAILDKESKPYQLPLKNYLFLLAITYDRIKIANCMINKYKINFESKDLEKILKQAIENNNLDFVELIIDKFFSNIKFNPLKFARSKKMAILLVNKGFGFIDGILDSKPLNHALRIGNNPLAKYYLEIGMKPTKSTIFNCKSVEMLRILMPQIQKSINDHQSKDGNTALHIACYEGNISKINLLLESGADANILNNDGETALFYAAGFDFDLSLLIDKTANINLKNKKGDTIMHYVQDCEIAKLLLEKGYKIEAMPTFGQSVFAAVCTNPKLYRYLMQRYMDQFPAISAEKKLQREKEIFYKYKIYDILLEQRTSLDFLIELLKKMELNINSRIPMSDDTIFMSYCKQLKSIFDSKDAGNYSSTLNKLRLLFTMGANLNFSCSDNIKQIGFLIKTIREILDSPKYKGSSIDDWQFKYVLDILMGMYVSFIDKSILSKAAIDKRLEDGTTESIKILAPEYSHIIAGLLAPQLEADILGKFKEKLFTESLPANIEKMAFTEIFLYVFSKQC